MDGVFLTIFNMAVSAGYLVVAVLIARLLLRRAPRWVHCVLWGLVGLRLILPFSLESVLSLIPSKEVVSPTIGTSPAPQIQTGLPVVDGSLNPVIGQTFTPAPAAPVNPAQVAVEVAAWVWLAGVAVLLLVATVSYWRLRRRVAEATPLKDNIFQCQNLPTTFILGIFKPRIYISYNISEAHLPLVLAHEQAHLKRRDHWIKPLAYLLLSVYWFHPLVWIGYILLCRDIELACDERVMRTFGADTRRAYAEALLYNGVHSRRIAACPLAFGEVGIKERVKSVMHYKKPAFWIVLVAVVACIVVAVCFLTSPKTTPTITGYGTSDEDVTIRVDELELEGEEPHITLRWKNDSKETVTLSTAVAMGYEEATPHTSFPPRFYKEEELKAGESITKTYSLLLFEFLQPGSYRLEFPYQKGLTERYTVGWVTFTLPDELAERLVAAHMQEGDLYPTGDGAAFRPITDEAFLKQHGYHVYYYGFDTVKLMRDGELIDLQAALNEGKVTVDDLLAYAADRTEAGVVSLQKEGDSVMYDFETYKIVKQQTADGRRHCFIGRPELSYQRLEDFSPEGLRVYDYTLSVRPGEAGALHRLTDDGYRAAHGFDVYTYGLESVRIETSGGTKDLGEVLRKGAVTAERLVADARQKWRNHEIGRDYTPDGPLYYLYKFGSYVLLHHMPEKGQGDLYIGTTDMDFSVLGDLTFQEPRITSLALAVQASEDRVLRKLTDDTFLKAHGFDVYTYGLDSVQVQTDQEMRDLKELLQNGSVTAEMLVNDARRQAARGEATMDTYKDGGSQIFRFAHYVLIKANSLDGDRNLYILAPGYDLNDVQPDVAAQMTVDVTGDGEAETLRLLRQSAAGDYTLDLLNPNGTLLWQEDFAGSHSGWNSLFLYTGEDGNYLLRYIPYIGGGGAWYSYTLFRVSGGQAEVKAQREIDVNLSTQQPLNVPELISYAEEINTLLQNSVLLFSNDRGVVGDEPLFGPVPGEQFLEDYDFLDGFELDIYAEGDDLAAKLQKFSDYMMATEGTSGETTTTTKPTSSTSTTEGTRGETTIAPTNTTSGSSTTESTRGETTTTAPEEDVIERPNAVFKTKNITRITFYAYYGMGTGSEVPAENMAEITRWLGSFTIDREVGANMLPPGTNTVYVEITYANGTVVKTGLDTVTVDGVAYYTKRENPPACLDDILSRTSIG